MKKVLSVVPVVVALTVTACSSPERAPEPSSTPSTATPTVTATPNPYASLSGAELGTRLLAASATRRSAMRADVRRSCSP